jgi:hypothetical protein
MPLGNFLLRIYKAHYPNTESKVFFAGIAEYASVGSSSYTDTPLCIGYLR